MRSHRYDYFSILLQFHKQIEFPFKKSIFYFPASLHDNRKKEKHNLISRIRLGKKYEKKKKSNYSICSSSSLSSSKDSKYGLIFIWRTPGSFGSISCATAGYVAICSEKEAIVLITSMPSVMYR